LQEVARTYGFPVVTCSDQNSARAVAQLKQWSPDLAIFTGGDIPAGRGAEGSSAWHFELAPCTAARNPRHEQPGMVASLWSSLGITIHLMDSGVDTGPILLRREFAGADDCEFAVRRAQQMIAEGIELVAEAVAGLDRGTISAVPQADREKDCQFFVMHEQLKAVAARRLKRGR